MGYAVNNRSWRQQGRVWISVLSSSVKSEVFREYMYELLFANHHDR
jgi:hypothetical protein